MLAIILLFLSIDTYAAEGKCTANDPSNSSRVSKCEDYDGKKNTCNKQRNCKWIDYNEDMTLCAPLTKADSDYCEDFDYNKRKCDERSDRCKWHNLGKPKAHCLPKTENGLDPLQSQHYSRCKMETEQDSCDDSTSGRCFWKVSIPAPPAPPTN